MSETPLTEKPDLREWDAETFGEHLTRDTSAGQVFALEGLTLSHLHRDLPELRSRLAQANIPLFTLDPTGVSGTGDTFVDILYSYVEEVEQRGKLTDDAQHLFEFVSSARDKTHSGFFLTVGGKLYNDTLCRLWTSLSTSVPAVLVVLNGHRLPASEASVVEHLCTYFYSDPVQEFAPEAASADYANGTLVFLDNGMEMPFDLDEVASQRIDLRESAEDSVREFLAEPDVIEKFVRSTGGDPHRLGELVESLPDDVENFWLFRYDRLDTLEKRIVELLVVAEEAISADTLHAALESLDTAEYFARSLRELTDNGFIQRKISSGVVRLQVGSSDFSHAVRSVMSEDQERRCHAALAEAETHTEAGDRSAHFLARHFLAAGDVERGLEHGMEAARKLVSERAYDRARELLETLEEHAADDATRKQLHAWSIDVHTALGNYRRALSHCEQAREFAESSEEKAQLLCDIGRLLIEVGEYEEAEERFESAVDHCDDSEELVDVRIRAKLGQGESLYSRGEHAVAEELAVETVESVQALKEAGASSTHALDLSLIHARNLIGKVSLYRGAFDKARRLFEENRALAREWGWSDELARSEANLGIVALQQRDLTAAQERLEAAQSIACSPVTVSPAQTWLNLGMVHQHQGSFDESLDYYLKSIRSARQSGDSVVYDVAVYNLVTLYQTLGAFERAYSVIRRLQETRVDGEGQGFIGSLPTVAWGSMLLDEQRFDEALTKFQELEDAVADENAARILPAAEAELRAVEAHFELGQVDHARRILEDFEMPGDAGENLPLSGLYKLGQAREAFRDERFADAAEFARGARKAMRDSGHDRDARRAALLLGKAMSEEGRGSEARSLLERELQELQEQSEHVPESLRHGFFTVPVHQKLVAVVRDLNGDVPPEFAVAPIDDEVQDAAADASAEMDVDADAFRRWRARYPEIVGEDERIHQIFRVIDRVADSESPVLLQGESGTGKELIAEAVHRHSNKSDGPLIKVNCAAFVEDLLLSELFGHVKGAFTGAVSDKIGRFEMADGGTIFLDEIGDISPKTQVALLRVLQEKTFEKVGGTETKKVDVRVVCATNKNLDEMVQRGDFRLDLYYRLKGVVIDVPPLRERRQDIPRLVTHFASKYAGGDEPKGFSRPVLKFLASYSWPGNIRELQNFVRSILLFVEGETVEMSHVREFSEFFAGGEVDMDLPDIDYDVTVEDYDDVGDVFEDPEEALVEQIIAEGLSLSNLKKRLELESIKRALIETGGNITRAAEILQMKRPRLSQIVNSTDELLSLKEELVG